jgi:hypothetical protein
LIDCRLSSLTHKLRCSDRRGTYRCTECRSCTSRTWAWWSEVGCCCYYCYCCCRLGDVRRSSADSAAHCAAQASAHCTFVVARGLCGCLPTWWPVYQNNPAQRNATQHWYHHKTAASGCLKGTCSAAIAAAHKVKPYRNHICAVVDRQFEIVIFLCLSRRVAARCCVRMAAT